MDPLSATLAVISLATALKDIIETAQIIQDSFSKHPQNYRNARRLSEEVLKTLRGMDEIYQEHEDIFNKVKPLKKAVNELQKEMKLAYEECVRLIPPVSERKRDRFKVAFYLFWNRAKVDQLLSELKEHVDRCSQQFHLLSSLRTEALVFEIRNAVVKSSSHVSTEIHGQSSFSSTSILHSGFGSVADTRLISFDQSSPMPMTWMTDTIPVYDLSKAYLRRELGRVDLSIKSALGRWSQNSIANISISGVTMSWFLSRPPASGTIIHQNAVVHAFRIQSILEEPDNSSYSWLHRVNLIMNQLVLDLNALHMSEDAIAVGTLRVNFWKAIQARYPSRNASRQLAHALTNIALLFSDWGNQKQARSKAEEAVQIFWSVAAQEPVMQARRLDVELVVRNMLLQAKNEPALDTAFQLAMDAGKVLEGSFGFLDAESELDASSTISSSNWSIIIGMNRSCIEEGWIASHDNCFTFASTVLRIAEIFRRYLQDPKISRNLVKSAREHLNLLLGTYPGSGIIQDELAGALARLTDVSSDSLDPESVPEFLECSKQNVTILRQLAIINPQHYVLRLSNALWSQSKILASIGKTSEAKRLYQDIHSLKELAAAPPHANLRIPSETEGDYYAQLAHYHHLAQRFPDAIYAVQNAISQYSALEFIDPGRSQEKHISALALLCNSFSFTQQYDAILMEGSKAIKMVDNINLPNSNPSLVESYRVILGTMMEALEVASDTSRALTQAADIVSRIQKLSRSGKVTHEPKSAQIPLRYTNILRKSGKIDDAIKYILDIRSRSNWETLYGDLSDISTVVPYIQCLVEVPSIFKAVGEIDKALRYNEEARMFITNFFGDTSHNFILLTSRTLTSEYIVLLCYAGQYPEALEFSQKVVRDADSAADTTSIVHALQGLTLTQLYNFMPYEAIASATRALSLCRTILPNNDPSQHTIQAMEYAFLLALSHCLHDIGHVSDSLKRLDEAEKVALELHSVYPMEGLQAIGDISYESLLTKRSRLLFAQGEFEEAVKLIEKVEIIQKKKCGIDKFALQELVNTLTYSGVLYCVVGRHDEGLAAAVKVAELRNSIRATFPAFTHLIDTGLNFLMKRGAWRSVEDAKKKLTCTHQNIFEILKDFESPIRISK